ncbi:MAG: 16S rRNA (uracil(1498)-N(3))-methyltransferase [Burkholderiales bacterium]|nr:16S rRNA (uracil(1498)-N(3))-methyltransferase [Burkholderiales bacterium]
MPRFYCPVDMVSGAELELPAGAARHVQVLRLQPGDAITLFHGGLEAAGPRGEFEARITHMGRSSVRAEVGAHQAIEREAAREVHLVAGITANERMDWLVEKATELGAASITPLLAERSVLKLKGERADKKRAHWQAIAIAACEQCGRNRVPLVAQALDLSDWLAGPAGAAPAQRLLLSLRAGSVPLKTRLAEAGPAVFLSGPEGGLSPFEEEAALAQGFVPVGLGPRVLRAETAALAALALMA